MKKRIMKRPAENVPEFELPSEDVKAVVEIHEALGVSVECAVELMLVATQMRLAILKTRKAYVEAIRKIEKKYAAKVAKRMPPFVKGGDPKYIALVHSLDESPKKGKRK